MPNEDSLEQFIANYRTEAFIPSLLPTLETIHREMLNEFKKWFKGMAFFGQQCCTLGVDP